MIGVKDINRNYNKGEALNICFCYAFYWSQFDYYLMIDMTDSQKQYKRSINNQFIIAI